MPISWTQYKSQRDPLTIQLFSTPSATRTVAISPHIWWMDQMAISLMNAGFNVLVLFPLYWPYTDLRAWDKFDELWNNLVKAIRDARPEAIIGGNASALLVHPKTGEMLHHAAGVPVVHFWWDEIRHDPPQAKRGMQPDEFLRRLKDDRTLNVIWDLDVLEEMREFFQLTNTLHMPLATLPEYWPNTFTPLEKRDLAACFLGNCHFPTDWTQTDDDPLVVWARNVIDKKIAHLDRPMRDCILDIGPAPTGPSKHLSAGKDLWMDFRRPWEILNAVYMHRTRNQLVVAAAEALKGKLALIGKGWDQLGLRANAEHAQDRSGLIYAQSRASLNLFGGCVHGGMPLRPYDIAASGGLIVTHYQRELPSLFEPNKECLAFRTQSEMLDLLQRIDAAPADFNPIVHAGRQRTLADHTWQKRMTAIMNAVQERFPR